WRTSCAPPIRWKARRSASRPAKPRTETERRTEERRDGAIANPLYLSGVRLRVGEVDGQMPGVRRLGLLRRRGGAEGEARSGRQGRRRPGWGQRGRTRARAERRRNPHAD